MKFTFIGIHESQMVKSVVSRLYKHSLDFNVGDGDAMIRQME